MAALVVVLLWGSCLAAPVAALEAKIELFVEDINRSIAFYRLLGFEVVHRKGDDYTTLRRGDSVVALSPLPAWLRLSWLGFLRHPPLGTELVFYVDDLDSTRVILDDAGHEPGEIALQPWGNLDFRLTDPDGYFIRVSEGRAVPAD